MEKSGEKSLIYFADPMCSWCWGFAPVIQQVRDTFSDLPIQMLMGGLSPGNTQIMDDAAKQEIKQHWQHVNEASGQPFDYEFFQRSDFIYDTEPASRAVIACFRQDSSKAFAFLKHLQQAFYELNQDITSSSQLIELAKEFGLDKAEFKRLLDDPETSRITQLSFDYARHLQVSGFPTLIGQTPVAHTVLTRGYQPYPQIEENIKRWLNLEK
jgi:putative protein-disulfide isomerase